MAEFGELLQQARAYKGVSLRDAERATKIPRYHLAALEREDFDGLPPLIYARGIVRNYAQYLGLDPVAMLTKFETMHGQRSGGFKVVPAVKHVDVPSHWAPNFAIIAFMVVISAAIFAWMYSAYFAPDSSMEDSNRVEAIATDQAIGAVPTATEEIEPEMSSGGGDPIPPENEEPENTSQEPEIDEVTPDETDVEAESTPEDPVTPEVEQTEETPAVSTVTVSTTAERVWLQAEVDGEIVFSDMIAAGSPQTFQGEQITLTSGNAGLVNVTVNGDSRGPLGDEWDAVQTYP